MTDRLTDVLVKSLKPQQREYVRRDPAHPGLGIRVHPTGRKSWIIFYDYRKRRRKFTLAPYPEIGLREARERYRQVRADLANGLDPATERQVQLHTLAETPTVAQLGEYYIEQHAKLQKKSWEEDQRILRKDVYPVWQHRLVSEISRRDVALLLDRVAGRGAPFSANALQVVLSSMFNYAVELEYIPANPASGLKKRGKYRRRERVLSIDEIATFFQVLRDQEETPEKIGLYHLQLLTAARPGEVRMARWSEFDLDAAVWMLPGARTKNARPHLLPLSDQAIRLLRSLQGRHPGWVFPSPVRPAPLSRYNQADAIRRMFEQGLLPFEAFTPHDLRRTASTHLAKLGVDRMVISKILNHLDEHQTAIYDRYTYMDEKRAALSKWGHVLEVALKSTGITS